MSRSRYEIIYDFLKALEQGEPRFLKSVLDDAKMQNFKLEIQEEYIEEMNAHRLIAITKVNTVHHIDDMVIISWKGKQYLMVWRELLRITGGIPQL